MNNWRFPMPATAMTAQAGTTQPATTAPAVVMPNFNFHVDTGASVLTITEGFLSLVAAVLLIVAGSLMLRNNPLSWRLHRLYIVIKIPVICFGAVATYWIYSSMMNSMMSLAGPGGPRPPAAFANLFALFEAAFIAVFSLIYPITLLFILGSKRSKSFYATLQPVKQ
jgi:hypothetical protein